MHIKDLYTHLKTALFLFAIAAICLSFTTPADAIQERELRVVNTDAIAGQSVTVPIELVSLGDENTVKFSIGFNPAIFSVPVVTLESGAAGAALSADLSQASSGHVGVTLIYPAGETFTAGTAQIVSIRLFVAAIVPPGPSPITIGDQPIVREILDASAQPLTALYTSGAINVTVPPSNPFPGVNTISPSSATVGSGGFTLLVSGTNFVNGAVVRWNRDPRPTTFVSAARLTATISAADIANAGAASVTVVNPAPGGGISPALTFTVNNLAPSIAGLSPTFMLMGKPAFALTVNGTSFTNSSVVRWNDADRPTTFVSATQLRAAISADDIKAPETANVKVFTPAPGGGATNALPFIVAGQLSSVSAASFLGSELAAESIIAGFGLNLATRKELAASVPLPTDLAGTRIMVKDSLGVERPAPQFFVDAGQANYQIPPGTASGEAAVTLTSGDNKVALGALQVTRIAPGIFTANANGQGVAAAVLLRVKPGGAQTFEVITRFDSTTNRFVSVPVDLGPETDQVFLLLFGTGFRYRSTLSAVNARIGGTNAEVAYAGPAPGFVGLDQSNIRLPRSLAGRGEIDVVLTVDGKTANTVRMSFK